MKNYVNNGLSVAYELHLYLKNIKDSVLEKLKWEQNLDYLTEEDLRHLALAADKMRQEMSRKNKYGVNPDTFYQ